MLEKGDLVRRRSHSVAACGFPARRLRKFVSDPTRFTTGPRCEAIIKWADMDQTLAESSYDMAVTSRSNTGTANSQEIQIAMEKIRIEQKLHNAALMPLGPSTGALRRSNR